MTSKEFLNNCTACGGNWAAMIMSGIQNCFPERYATLEDRRYDTLELLAITADCGVDWEV